ncbi:LamG-like jellyroll fold domain-containing protein [Sinomicrobium sp. M5D2P9]
MKQILLLLLAFLLSVSLYPQVNPSPKKDYRILHVNKKFTPKKGFAPDAKSSHRANTDPSAVVYDEDRYFIIQFEELPTRQQKDRLRQLGINLLDYIPNMAYYARFDKEVHTGNLTGFKLRTILPIDEDFKLSGELHADRIPSHLRKGTNLEVEITLFEGINTSAIQREIGRYASVISKRSDRHWQVLVSPDKLRDLATVNGILYIEPASGEPRAEDDRPAPEDKFSNGHSRSNFLNTGFGGILYNGEGVNVMVRENSIYPSIDTHGRLMDGSDLGNSPSSHSTGVASYLAGAGNGNPRDRSNAWGADILSVSGQNTYELYDDPERKIRVTNMSYGWWNTDNQTVQAGYNSLSQEHDNFIRTRPEAMLVYSSGNVGGYTPIGGLYNGITGWANISGHAKHAKNLLTISGTDYEDTFLEWTCKGPAYDGRIKPDLSIEGQGGTSFAAPKISGIFTILHQAYKEETSGSMAPSALIKAILLNTADDIHNKGIDFKTGFGRPNVRRAYEVIKDGQHFAGSVANGQEQTFAIQVPSGISQFRVMVYWHDYEATPGAARALVNDLDIVVKDPGNTETLPWVLDTIPNPANLNALPSRNEDHINNVEQVTIDNPSTGSYTVSVKGYNIPEGPQEFFVVYEFLREEVILTHPIGNTPMAPGDEEYIRWDAYGDPGTFDLDYSTDNGATWNSIAANLPEDQRQYRWTVPELETDILVRVKRGEQVSVSEPFSIFPAPTDFKVDWACEDAVQLSWDKVPEASEYELFRLGEKYMETIGTTTDSLFIFPVTDAGSEEWFSIRAIGPEGQVSLRANAVRKSEGQFKCSPVITSAAFEVRKDSVLLTGEINAMGKTLADIKFEYGPTASYGSELSVPGTYTGTRFTQIQRTAMLNLQSGETWHYRLKGKLDGEDVYGESHTFQPSPGNSMVFNGGETIIVGPNDAVNGNKARTIECWVRTDTYNSDGGVINLPGGAGTTRGDFTLSTNGGEGRWKLSLWNVTRSYTLPENKGQWHHMAITYNPENTTAELYYDGILWDTWNTGGELNTIPGNIRLGARNNGGDKFYKGEMDEIRIWSTVRTASQIRENMHHPLSGVEEGLEYYINFDHMGPETYEVRSRGGLSYTGNPLKAKAEYPFGEGNTSVKPEVPGSVVFSENVGVTAHYNAPIETEASFSRITLTSVKFDGFSPSASILGNEFWIGHRYTQSTDTLNMDISFKSSAGITENDEQNPGYIHLFSRAPYTSEAWIYDSAADSAHAQQNSVTLNNRTSYTQYLFLRDENPFVYATRDSLFLSDTRVDAVTQSVDFDISGANLSGDISVIPPEGFEISVNDSIYIDNSASLDISPGNNEIKSTKLYARFAPKAAGNHEGHIKILSGAAVLDSIRVMQEAIEPEITAGKALSFNGNSDYLEIQDLNWQPAEFTIEWWHKANSYNNYNQQIGNGWGSFLIHAGSSGDLSIGVANNNNSRMTVPGAFSDTGNWHHFAYTFHNGEARIYMDGELIDSKTSSDAPPMWSVFRIGSPDSNTIDGEIDEFRMWEAARTPQEIRENMYHTLEGIEPGLKLYLQFQETEKADLIADLSDHGLPVRVFNTPARVISSAPVAKGISKTLVVDGAGTYDFGETGMALIYDDDEVDPNGETVISRLDSSPYQAPEMPLYKSSYWIAKNYANDEEYRIQTVILKGVADCTQQLQLHKRAPQATEEWISTGPGINQGEDLYFTSPAPGMPDSQLIFAQYPVASPLSVTVEDVFAINPGGLPNTIYLGYGPEELLFHAEVNGGVAPYHYEWSNGTTGNTLLAAPEEPGKHQYDLVVTDAIGCTESVSVTVNVKDVSCKGKKIAICHRGKQLCISPRAIGALLAIGATLGACSDHTYPGMLRKDVTEENNISEGIMAYPNPASSEVSIEGKLLHDGPATIHLYNLSGNPVLRQKIQVKNGSYNTRLNISGLSPGVYIISETDNSGKERSTKIVIR